MMEQQDMEYVRQMMAENEQVIAPLVKYLPWLEQKSGSAGSTLYSGSGLQENSVAFPVYDSTLMSFLREAEKTSLMDRNYPYTFTRNNLKTPTDIRLFIEAADWRSWDALRGILSKYVMGGRTKSTLWSEGISEGIFFLLIDKMNEIVKFWKGTAL